MAQTGPTHAVLAEQLVRRYRRSLWGRSHTALDGVHLALGPGEFLALVGANGSGKSTLLRLVAGVERPDRGRVAVFGSHAHGRAARARTGYLPEGTPWPPELGLEAGLSLLLALRGYGRKERRRLAQAALEDFGLWELRGTPLGQASSGQRRRFGLAQALGHAPDLLLLDEPTVGLDAAGVEALDRALRAARARGAAAIIASHLPADLWGQCERLVLLGAGRVVGQGPMGELAERAGRVELEVELAAGVRAEALAQALAPAGAKLLALRPSSAGLLCLEDRAGKESAR